jgi:hypothetical protein
VGNRIGVGLARSPRSTCNARMRKACLDRVMECQRESNPTIIQPRLGSSINNLDMLGCWVSRAQPSQAQPIDSIPT